MIVAGQPQSHMARSGTQPGSPAFGAGAPAQITPQLLAYLAGLGIPTTAFEVGNHPLEALVGRCGGWRIGRVADSELARPRAVKNHLLYCLGQLRKRLVEIKAQRLRKAGKCGESKLVASVPSADRARCKTQVGELDHAVGVDVFDVAQAIAVGAGARRVVEGKEPRFEVGAQAGAIGACETAGERVFAAVVGFDRARPATGQPKCGFKGIGEPLPHGGGHPQPVDDHLDRGGCGGQPRGRLGKLDQLAVDSRAHKSLRLQVGDGGTGIAAAFRWERREDHEPRALAQREHLVNHLRDGLSGKCSVRVVGAVRGARSRIKQSQVIIDFCDGSDRGPGVVAARLLLDCNRGRQPLDQIDVRLFHELQELPRIG